VCLYRDDEFLIPDDETRLQGEDEVAPITHCDKLDILVERFETAQR